MDEPILNVAGEPYDGPVPTGRTFIYDNLLCECVPTVPDHDDWHRYTEVRDPDGDLWYESDHPDGYVLDAEEFGDTDTPEVKS